MNLLAFFFLSLLWLKNISDFRQEISKSRRMVVDASKYLTEMKNTTTEELAPIWARMGKSTDQITIKTPNSKCLLYWCLIEFIDWRYSQSCWYFQPLL
jgi:hypothetical protein